MKDGLFRNQGVVYRKKRIYWLYHADCLSSITRNWCLLPRGFLQEKVHADESYCAIFPQEWRPVPQSMKPLKQVSPVKNVKRQRETSSSPKLQTTGTYGWSAQSFLPPEQKGRFWRRGGCGSLGSQIIEVIHSTQIIGVPWTLLHLVVYSSMILSML